MPIDAVTSDWASAKVSFFQIWIENKIKLKNHYVKKRQATEIKNNPNNPTLENWIKSQPKVTLIHKTNWNDVKSFINCVHEGVSQTVCAHFFLAVIEDLAASKLTPQTT